MPAELWTKLIADAPILAILLIVLWKGGEKLDKLGEKFDKLTSAVKVLSGRVELVGKLQDARLELHEARTTGTHAAVGTPPTGVAAVPRTSLNGTKVSQPSWPETHVEDEEE